MQYEPPASGSCETVRNFGILLKNSSPSESKECFISGLCWHQTVPKSSEDLGTKVIRQGTGFARHGASFEGTPLAPEGAHPVLEGKSRWLF